MDPSIKTTEGTTGQYSGGATTTESTINVVKMQLSHGHVKPPWVVELLLVTSTSITLTMTTIKSFTIVKTFGVFLLMSSSVCIPERKICQKMPINLPKLRLKSSSHNMTQTGTGGTLNGFGKVIGSAITRKGGSLKTAMLTIHRPVFDV